MDSLMHDLVLASLQTATDPPIGFVLCGFNRMTFRCAGLLTVHCASRHLTTLNMSFRSAKLELLWLICTSLVTCELLLQPVA